MMRFDPKKDFQDPTAWIGYDLTLAYSDLTATDFNGSSYDGRYLYFVPKTVSPNYVLRLDTQGEFKSASSWKVFDPSNLIGTNLTRGYRGSIFDGKYVYFVPYNNGTTAYHGYMLRYDTTQSFETASSWSTFDSNTTEGLTTKGFLGATFDGRYVYYAPFRNRNIVRYDTTGDQLNLEFLTNLGVNDGYGNSMNLGPSLQIKTANKTYHVLSKSPIQDSEWHFLVATYDGSIIKLYLDGSLIASQEATGDLALSSDQFKIGSRSSSSLTSLDAELNDVQIYSKALSQSQINSLLVTQNLCD
jgi:hypothetical protein